MVVDGLRDSDPGGQTANWISEYAARRDSLRCGIPRPETLPSR